MIKILLKKQLLEATAGIRMEREGGSMRKAGSLFLIFLALGYVLLLLCSMVGFFTKSIAPALWSEGLSWLYFAVVGIAAASIGVLCTVFTASDSLFQGRDNELLLSLPISHWQILLARMLGVYLMNLLAMGLVFVPALLVYLGASHDYGVFPMGMVTFLLLGLFVLVVDCLLGWVIAAASLQVKRKSLVAVVLAVVFLLAYYQVYSHFEAYLSYFLSQSQAIAAALRRAAYPLYVFGQSGSGDVAGLLQFAAFVGLLLLPTWLLLKRSFFRLAARQGDSAVSQPSSISAPAHRPAAALLQKEWRSFSGSSNYILSCGLGLILAGTMGFSLLAQPEMGQNLFSSFERLLPQVQMKSGLILGSMACVCLSMCNTAAASVSLEGERLWILKSLPIKPETILLTKADLQWLLCLPAGVFLLAVCALSVRFPWTETLIAAGYVLLVTRFLSYLNVIWNIRFPKLTWTSELVPMRQSLSVVLAGLGGMFLVMMLLLCYISLAPYLGHGPTQGGLMVLVLAACGLSHRWIMGRGAQLWREL